MAPPKFKKKDANFFLPASEKNLRFFKIYPLSQWNDLPLIFSQCHFDDPRSDYLGSLGRISAANLPEDIKKYASELIQYYNVNL